MEARFGYERRNLISQIPEARFGYERRNLISQIPEARFGYERHNLISLMNCRITAYGKEPKV